jgi:acetyltransferase-like isoleucine patch superfamily enzyme
MAERRGMKIKTTLKWMYARMATPILRVVFGLFYHRKYLIGRYFDFSYAGWFKAWRGIWLQKIGGFNRHVPWPVSPFIAIDEPGNIIFDPDDMQNFWHFGCYYSNRNGGRIEIGKGTWIAPNVGIITTNHDLKNPDAHLPPRNVKIGRRCWIGMNAVILPGVELADGTVVGAGSVVTRSFMEGDCVIGGVPAKRLKSSQPGSGC